MPCTLTPIVREELHNYGVKAIEEMATFDPTPGLKYLNWMITRYKSKKFKWEDLEKLKPQLEMFDRLVKSKRIQKRDIMQYATPGDLYNTVKPFMDGEEDINADGEKRRKYSTPPQGRLIYQSGGCTVVVPETWECARFWGSNTNWCTVANEGHFNHYYEQGPLYNILVQRGDGVEKFQFHFESSQLLDSADMPLTDEQWAMIPPAALDAIVSKITDPHDQLEVLLSSVPQHMKLLVSRHIDWHSIPEWSESGPCLVRFLDDQKAENLPADIYDAILPRMETIHLFKRLRYIWSKGLGGRQAPIVEAINFDLRKRDFTRNDFDYMGPQSMLTCRHIDADNLKRVMELFDIRKDMTWEQVFDTLIAAPAPWIMQRLVAEAAPEPVLAAAAARKDADWGKEVAEKRRELPLPNGTKKYVPGTNKQEIMEVWSFRAHDYSTVEDSLFTFAAEAIRKNIALHRFDALDNNQTQDLLKVMQGRLFPIEARIIKFGDYDTAISLMTMYGGTELYLNGKRLGDRQSVMRYYDSETVISGVLGYLYHLGERVTDRMHDDYGDSEW